jgi:hypothetical protein
MKRVIVPFDTMDQRLLGSIWGELQAIRRLLMSDPNRKAEKAEKQMAAQQEYLKDAGRYVFKEWPKIGRLNRDIVITEKIDGTNGAIGIVPISGEGATLLLPGEVSFGGTIYQVYAQSRSRIVTPENDNYGFAAWVRKNAKVLVATLGEGLHFGEWWGVGINRGYGLTERRFSLFNTSKWGEGQGALLLADARLNGVALYSVPVLFTGPWTLNCGYIDGEKIASSGPDEQPWLKPEQMQGWPGVSDQPNPRPRYTPNFICEWLEHVGSFAAEGYMEPEGIVIYHKASDTCFKMTIKDDEKPKGTA